MDLRTVTISTTKAASAGRAYTDTFLGLTAVEPTAEGEAFVGTVTAVDSLGYATITDDSGRWVRSASNYLRVPTADLTVGRRRA